MRYIYILLALAVFVSAASAIWEDGTATAQVCFNATASGSTIYPKTTGATWTVFDVAIPNTGGFFDGNLYGNGFGLFKYSQNSTHAFLALPARTSATSQQYCIYAGGSDNEGLNGNVAYIYYSDAQGGWTTSSGTVAYGSNMVLSSSSALSTSYKATGASYTYMKARVNSSFDTPSNGYAMVGTTSSTTACSTGCMYMNKTGAWLRNGALVYQDPSVGQWRIVKALDSSTWYVGVLYNDSMSQLGTTTGVAAVTRTYIFAQSKNATEYMDWAFLGKVSSTSFSPSQSNIVFDFQDTNITINSPTWNSNWDLQDNAPLSITFGQAYDECNVTLNGGLIYTFAPGAGDTETGNIDMYSSSSGRNELNVSCVIGGLESHRYGMFLRTSSVANNVFVTAFGMKPTDMGCTSNVSNQLERCYEGYHIDQGYNFSAVVCPSMNFSYDYSCLNASNVTKNGYTIFYRPVEYIYPGTNHAAVDIEHIGANFIYYGSALEPGFELIAQNYTGIGHGMFVYIPAQNKDRDCGIFYQSNTSGCSWGSGFVLNQGVVTLSDRNNNWFTAGSSGIEPFNINFSQQAPPTTIYSIIEHADDVFTNGIYTRLNCLVMNNTFVIRIKNTVLQNYTLYIVGNGTADTNQSTSSYTYYRDIDLSGGTVAQVIVYDTTGKPICQYAGNNNLFLPFQLPAAIIGAPYQIITWAMMIFMVVLTSIVPFAAILVILWNDVYHMLNISQVALICMLSVVFGFVNSSFNAERGIKHMLIILAIATAYLAAIAPYAEHEGISISGFDGTLSAFNGLRSANDIGTFVLGIPGFIIQLFMMMILLPVTFVNFILAMLYHISIPLWTATSAIAPFITVGFVLYFYLKAYEVLANRFRPV